MQLKVTADIKGKYEIRKSKERTIRRVSSEKMYVQVLFNIQMLTYGIARAIRRKRS